MILNIKGIFSDYLFLSILGKNMLIFNFHSSLSRERRERELLRITKENQDILKRLMSKKPEISAKELRKDWDYNTKLMNNISTFPEEWYKKSKDSLYGKSMRKTTNLNKSKSEGDKLNKSKDENIDKNEE
jgi:hypothetical protein